MTIEAQNLLTNKTVLSNMKKILHLDNLDSRVDDSIEQVLETFLKNFCISSDVGAIDWFDYHPDLLVPNHDYSSDYSDLSFKTEHENEDRGCGHLKGGLEITDIEDEDDDDDDNDNLRYNQSNFAKFFEPFLFFTGPQKDANIRVNDYITGFLSNDFNSQLYDNPEQYVQSLENFEFFWHNLNKFFTNANASNYNSMLDILKMSKFFDNLDKTLCLWNNIYDFIFGGTPNQNIEKNTYMYFIKQKEKWLFPYTSSFRDHAFLMTLILNKTASNKFEEAKAYGPYWSEISDILYNLPMNGLVLQPHYLMLVLWIFGIIKRETTTTFLNIKLAQNFTDPLVIMIVKFILVKIMDFINGMIDYKRLSVDGGLDFEFDTVKNEKLNSILSMSGTVTCKNFDDFKFIITHMGTFIENFKDH